VLAFARNSLLAARACRCAAIRPRLTRNVREPRTSKNAPNRALSRLGIVPPVAEFYVRAIQDGYFLA
jgi:hypothetical protein